MILIILAAICFLLSVVFYFFVIGYVTTALAFAALGCICVLFWWLGRMKNQQVAGVLRRITLVILLIGILFIVIAEIPIIKNARTDTDAGADYLIVLGAGVNGTVPSLSLTNRLNAALEYLDSYPQSLAIVSGGQGDGEDISEALAMYTWLTDRGVEAERIIMEDKSTSTQENIQFSLDIMRERGDEDGSVAIVSSEYHLYRAKMIAQDCGLQAKGVAADTTIVSIKLNYFLREAFAVWYMWVFQ